MDVHEENIKLNLEQFALVEKEKRNDYIDRRIISALPEYKRTFAKPRVIDIVDKFIGRDPDALSVLRYAAERGRFDEFMDKLEKHYHDDIIYRHPESRMMSQHAELFFLDCYKTLGAQPQKNS